MMKRARRYLLGSSLPCIEAASASGSIERYRPRVTSVDLQLASQTAASMAGNSKCNIMNSASHFPLFFLVICGLPRDGEQASASKMQGGYSQSLPRAFSCRERSTLKIGYEPPSPAETGRLRPPSRISGIRSKPLCLTETLLLEMN